MSKDEQRDNELIAKSEYKPENTLWEVKRLLQLAVPQKRKLYAGIGLLCISASVSMSVPLALGKTLDVFTKAEVSAQLPVSVPVAASLLCGFLAIGVRTFSCTESYFCATYTYPNVKQSIATFGRVLLMRIAGQSIIRDARQACMANILRQDMPFFDLQGDKPVAALESTPSSNKQPQQQQTQDQTEAQKLAEASKEADSVEASSGGVANQDHTRVRSTGDIISRISADASMVGDALTRELTVRVLYSKALEPGTH